MGADTFTECDATSGRAVIFQKFSNTLTADARLKHPRSTTWRALALVGGGLGKNEIAP